jgi:hypothetical protein
MNGRLVGALVAGAILLGGGGFAAGMTLGPTLAGKGTEPSPSAQAGPGGRQPVAVKPGGGAGGPGNLVIGGSGQVVGRVLSVNDGSITIEVRQPGSDTPRSQIALVGGTSRLVKTVETDIRLSDIKPGDQVVVIGQTDQTTGTVSANAVIVGQSALQQLFGGGQGGARPSGSGSPRPSPSARP